MSGSRLSFAFSCLFYTIYCHNLQSFGSKIMHLYARFLKLSAFFWITCIAKKPHPENEPDFCLTSVLLLETRGL